MNNFNSTFLAIKTRCGSKGMLEGPGCFDIIAADAGIPGNKIEFFLNTLQNLELIKYSFEEQYIKLTHFGKKQQRLFTDT